MANGKMAAATLALAMLAGSAAGDPIVLDGGNVRWSIEPGTLALSAIRADGVAVVLSDGLATPAEPSAISAKSDAAEWKLAAASLGVRVRVLDGSGLEIEFAAGAHRILPWPSMRIDASSELVWPRGEGNLVPVGDPLWRGLLVDKEWNTLESLGMPFWGVRSADSTVSWMASTQFRNAIDIEEDEDGALALGFSHDFNVKSPERSVAFRVFLDDAANPVVPALHYRAWLLERGRIVPMEQKVLRTPKAERLLGAPHAYVWGHDPITRFDVPRDRWKPLCARLLAESAIDGGIAHAIRKSFADDQWKAVEELARAEWGSNFAKNAVAAGLSAWLRSGNASEGVAARVDRNAAALVAEFPEDFLPARGWGNGSSLKMLRALQEAGIERIKLCADGWSGFETRPWVAEEADRLGWLVGTYDSYHSVHDPAAAGTEGTWETAQMTPELWESGGIMRADGTYIAGFRQTGRRLSPVAGRTFAEHRMGSLLAAVPFNYHFLDCDAFGEVADDFHPVHPASMEEDARARCERLEWISRTHGAVVGSEGGSEYAINSVHVVEGVFGPFFGWDDEDMRDKGSEYYRGRYYPPDAPDVNFKPVPLKERFAALQYAPQFRIPLFQTVFHDAVVATHHWSNAHFKYPEVRQTTALAEMLYLCPPMYHLNIDEFAKRRTPIMEHVRAWSPVHRRHGFAPMTSFRHLSEDRLVQETRFGEVLRIVVNFGETAWSGEGIDVPGRSSLVIEEGRERAIYSPSPDDAP